MRRLLLLLSLCGCMVGPDYRRPVVETPQSWRVEDNETKELVNTDWWEQFDDPVLNELISASSGTRISSPRPGWRSFRTLHLRTRSPLPSDRRG